jgi:hypothetical protein
VRQPLSITGIELFVDDGRAQIERAGKYECCPESVSAKPVIVHSERTMRRPAEVKRKPPHAFVLEALAPANPEVRRMFSGFAVYLGNRIVCMLRDHEKSPEDNGVWLVLSESANPADPDLRREFPSIRSIGLLGDKIRHWLLIPSDSPGFEMEALRACDLLLHRDPRLGRIPQSRR